MTSSQSMLLEELKGKIIAALSLNDITPEDIEPDAPLLGSGLGIDSIDTLELVVLIEKDYGVKIDNKDSGQIAFASLRSLATYIEQNRLNSPS